MVNLLVFIIFASLIIGTTVGAVRQIASNHHRKHDVRAGDFLIYDDYEDT